MGSKVVIKVFLVCFTLNLMVTSLSAEEVPTSKKINTYLRQSFSNIDKELLTVFKNEALIILLAGGTATLALSTIFRNNFVLPLQDTISRSRPLGKYTLIGDYAGQMLPNLLYSASMFTLFLTSKDKLYLKRTVLMLKASLYSGIVTRILKASVRETRPNKGDDLSFPSGHTTTAFAFSSYVAAEHGLWPWGIGALALSTLTAFSRMNDNKHYLHDVVAEATIGAVFGVGLQSLYKRTKNKTSAQGSSSNDVWRSAFVLPVYDTDFKGLSVSMEF